MPRRPLEVEPLGSISECEHKLRIDGLGSRSQQACHQSAIGPVSVSGEGQGAEQSHVKLSDRSMDKGGPNDRSCTHRSNGMAARGPYPYLIDLECPRQSLRTRITLTSLLHLHGPFANACTLAVESVTEEAIDRPQRHGPGEQPHHTLSSRVHFGSHYSTLGSKTKEAPCVFGTPRLAVLQLQLTR